MEENNVEERIDHMPKITFPDQFESEARTIIAQMIKNNLNGAEIPNSDGQVIIREKSGGVETGEFEERAGEPDIVMVPIVIKVIDKEETFFICSR